MTTPRNEEKRTRTHPFCKAYIKGQMVCTFATRSTIPAGRFLIIHPSAVVFLMTIIFSGRFFQTNSVAHAPWPRLEFDGKLPQFSVKNGREFCLPTNIFIFSGQIRKFSLLGNNFLVRIIKIGRNECFIFQIPTWLRM